MSQEVKGAAIKVEKEEKKKDKKGQTGDLSSSSPPYIPLSVCIKEATRGYSSWGFKSSPPHPTIP